MQRPAIKEHHRTLSCLAFMPTQSTQKPFPHLADLRKVESLEHSELRDVVVNLLDEAGSTDHVELVERVTVVLDVSTDLEAGHIVQPPAERLEEAAGKVGKQVEVTGARCKVVCLDPVPANQVATPRGTNSIPRSLRFTLPLFHTLIFRIRGVPAAVTAAPA